MAYSKAFLEEVKRRTSLPDLIGRFVSLRRAGSNLVGCCPFHSEKTPSFTVFSATNSFYCFGCGAGGDAITFCMQAEGLEYREAVERLATLAGVPPEEETRFSRSAPDTPTVKKERLFEVNKAAARFFYANLSKECGAQAYAYLQKRRFSDLTIRRFGIGYAPDSWDALTGHLQAEGFSPLEITTAFLGRTNKRGGLFDLFRNRVMFPIFDLNGEVVAFSGRKLREEDDPKYVNTSDTPVFKKSRILFGMHLAKREAGDGLILCEGAPDCIAMQQAGFGNAVATLGTAITGEHARLIARFTKMVYLAYDIDRAGRKATMRGIELLNQVGVDTRVINLGDGDSKDPDEFIKNHGAAAFREKLSGSQGQIDYRIGEILGRYDLKQPDEKLRCSTEMASYIATLSSRMEREIYASRAAERLGVSAPALRDEAERSRKKLESSTRKQEMTRAMQNAAGYGDHVNRDKLRFSSEAPHEEAILGILLLHPEFGKKACGLLQAEDFATAFNRKLWELFAPAFAEGVEPELHADGQLSVREVGTVQGYRAAREKLAGNTEEALHAHIEALQEQRSKREYDRKIEEDPAAALAEYVAQLQKKKQDGNT